MASETAAQKEAKEQHELYLAGLVPAEDNSRSLEQQYPTEGTYPDISDPERARWQYAAIDEYRNALATGNPLPIEYLAAKLGRDFDEHKKKK